MGTRCIPEKVVYFMGRPTVVGMCQRICGPDTRKYKAQYANVADPRNASTMAGARKSFNGIEVELPNDPIPYIRVVEESYASHGKNYVALVHDWICVTLDNTALLETLNNGRLENGLLEGPFVWCRITQGLDLVRVGSHFHQRGLLEDGMKMSARIPSKDLLPGHVYKIDDGSELVYVGMVELDKYHHTKASTALTRETSSGRLWLPQSLDGIYIRHLHLSEKRPIEGPLRKAEWERDPLEVLRGKALTLVESECSCYQRRLRNIRGSKTRSSSVVSEPLYFSGSATWLTVRRKGEPRVEHPRLAQLDAATIQDTSKAGTKGSR